MKYHQEVFIPKLPKLPNRMGWGKLNRFYEAKKWMVLISKYFICKTPEEPLKKCMIQFYRQSAREPDTDNNYASIKPVLDALKKNGIIIDDKPSVVDLKVSWLKSSYLEKGIRITIDEI